MKMKKILGSLMAVLMLLSMLAGCGKTDTPAGTPAVSSSPSAVTAAPSTEPVEKKGTLLMATTTSTDNTGLLDYLAPIFLEETGWELQWTAVGTGEALQLGMDGEVDVVLVHAKAKEEAFVTDGYGTERVQVMYNDFVIVGPKDGTIAYTDNIESVFTQILSDSLTFVSRGDDSGTHTKELSIWNTLTLDYESNPNYISTGAGMGDTIVMADEKQGYCLADRGTWLATKKNAEVEITLEIICEGDKNLLNQYGVIAVNPDKYPDVNNAAANAFIEWICADKIQQLIGQFGIAEYGGALFTPNAA